MPSRITYSIFLAFLTAAVVACAPPFPKELMQRVDRDVSFKDLREEPERFAGSLVMLGGQIVSLRNTGEGTYLEILQRRLDSAGRPIATDETGGRFIAFTTQFLDAAIYSSGRQITVIGEVAGVRIQPLGEVQYRYPYIITKAIHLWEPYVGPRFHIGIGVWREI